MINQIPQTPPMQSLDQSLNSQNSTMSHQLSNMTMSPPSSSNTTKNNNSTPSSTKSTPSRIQTPSKSSSTPQNPSTIHTGKDHVQKLLDENSYLISIICNKQQDGNMQPVGQNHELLQKNLAYLASLAEIQQTSDTPGSQKRKTPKKSRKSNPDKKPKKSKEERDK